MTVNAAYAVDRYAGAPPVVAFATTFPYFSDTDLVVTLRDDATGADTLQTLGVDYTASTPSPAPGVGTVTFVTAPAAGKTVVIERSLPLTQLLDYVENDAFPAQTHEEGMDRLVLLAQERQEELSRTPKFPATDPTTSHGDWPSHIDRASKYAGWDADGKPITVASAVGITAVVTPFAETLLDDGDAATARATLDTFEDVFTTRGDLLRAGASGVEERLALGAADTFLKSDGTDAVWDQPEADEVVYDPTTSGLVATDVQAAIDERIRTLTQKTSDETATDFSTETVVGGLNNISFPGTPDGSRVYRIVGQLLLLRTGSGSEYAQVKVRIGTNGDVTDAVKWEGGGYNEVAAGFDMSISFAFPYVPASGEKISVTLHTAGNLFDVRGDATVLESYFEVYLI